MSILTTIVVTIVQYLILYMIHGKAIGGRQISIWIQLINILKGVCLA